MKDCDYLQTYFVYHMIFTESACHDEQNSSQTFILQARITELWQLKAHKVENNDKEDGLLFFKPADGFFRCVEIFSRN